MSFKKCALLVALMFTAAVAGSPGMSLASGARSSVSPLVKLTHDAKLGDILVTNQGFTLYHLLGEDTGKSICAKKSGCSGTWPPLLLPKGQKKLKAGQKGAGISDRLGVTKAAHKRLQITYDGWKLYRFSGDSAPGQVSGDGITDGFGKWKAVSNQPMVAFTITITHTGTTAWGTVSLSYGYKGQTVTPASCSQATCVDQIHAGSTVLLSETPTDASTWPWVGWSITAANGGGSSPPKASSVKVTSNDDYIIDARYSGYGL